MTPIDWSRLRALVFDFDGVIVESVEIKRRALPALFADRPQLHPAIERHHQEHLGHSRYRKFEWIYAELLGEPLSEERSRELGRRYAELVVEATVACPEVPGAEALLRRLQGVAPAFVVSGTPQEELEWIVGRRRLGGYFAELHGAPRRKPEILADLLRRWRLDPRQVVMVGDGLSDHRAAEACGIGFVLRATAAQEELFAGLQVVRVADLLELATLLEPLFEARGDRAARAARSGEAGG